ncbi:protein translocase subunit SecF [Amphibiibacter pelophylacis]|uniref:Protein translocase subunit SecF n=1 Tax=Amphibiibacter pelophylacis TaxID=1799477 RepID=A0ACC6P0J9_9BURK
MELFRIRRDIPFMRHALVLNAVSFITFLLAVFFIVTRGLHLSVEFTGGTVIEAAYTQPANLEKVRHAVESLQLGETLVQNFGTSRDVMIRVPVRKDVDSAVVAARVFGTICSAEGGSVKVVQQVGKSGEAVTREACTAADGSEPIRLSRTEFIGPAVGAELASSGAMALGFVVVLIMAYLALRFEWKFAVAGIIANLHDVVIILGFFAFFQWEFSLAVLAAVLAVLGYSVNESVVIFDRVREMFRKTRSMDTPAVINHAITSTISRTIITHGSTQMMVLSMLFFGGPTLHYFALALTIGICFGIYSSVFVAASIAMWLGVQRSDLVKTGNKGHDDNDPNAGAVV